MKNDIPTKLHSLLSAMSAYIAQLEITSSVVKNLNNSLTVVPKLTKEQQNTLAEITYVLAEVRRFVSQLDANKKVSVSRAPRLLKEL